jgi:hypothetical protein
MQRIEFSVIIFPENGSQPLKYRTVTNLADLVRRLNIQYSSINVYRRRTKEFLIQIKSLQQWYEYYNSLSSKYE